MADSSQRYRIRYLTHDDDVSIPRDIISAGYRDNYKNAVRKVLLLNWRFQVTAFAIGIFLSRLFHGDVVGVIVIFLMMNIAALTIGVIFYKRNWKNDADHLDNESVEDAIDLEEFWVAELEEPEGWEMVGSISLGEPDDDMKKYIVNPRRTLELKRWSIAPGKRGKKLGARLLQHATDYASTMKYREVVCYCWNVQQRALKVYKRAGFQKKKTLKYKYMFGLFRFNLYVMSKMC
ncbi:uncharacterized protein LOC120331392 [Styela clava]